MGLSCCYVIADGGNHTLAGGIKMRTNTLDRRTQFREGFGYLQSGQAMEESGRFEAAIRDFQEGLRVIGEDYGSVNTIDDTSMKFMLARTQIQGKQFKQAAAVLQRILETRLNLFAGKYRISD
jgi:hypothetical protein